MQRAESNMIIKDCEQGGLVVKNLMAEKLWENGTVDRSLFIHVYVT
jgi:hypothetical protein